MLHTSHILKTLKFLDREFNKHITSFERERPIMFSKLGVLELSGWVEEGFDEIARSCVRSKLKTGKLPAVLERKIDKTYGFTYKENSRELLAVAFGTIKLLEVERDLNRDGSLLILRSELGALNKQRNAAAHTFTRGMTLQFDAPSVTIDRFHKVRPVLQRLWDTAHSV